MNGRKSIDDLLGRDLMYVDELQGPKINAAERTGVLKTTADSKIMARSGMDSKVHTNKPEGVTSM